MGFVTAENSARTDTYPFTTQVPFGNYFIQSIKLVLKKVHTQPVLSILTAREGQCSATLTAGNTVLATVQYEGNLWMTFDTQHAFGFIKLRVRPSAVINFSGILPLNRLTYNYAFDNGGMKTIRANDTQYPVGDTLDINVSGALYASNMYIQPVQTSDSDVSNSTSDAYMYIRRINDTLYDFIQTPTQANQQVYIDLGTGKYINSVNGTNIQSLNIVSGCSEIRVQDPVLAGDNVYIMYVTSATGFPTCAQQDNGSDSQQQASKAVVK